MTRTNDEAIAAAIGDLDGEGLGAFVADLYRARGWSVERDGQRLSLARDGERETLVVRPASHRARLFGPGPKETETVVSARPGEGDLDRSDLVSMLRYGVPPETGAELGERHLGAPPAALDPPKRIRLRRALDDAPLRETAVAVAVLLTAAALVASIPVGGLLADAGRPANGTSGVNGTETTVPDGTATAAGATTTAGNATREQDGTTLGGWDDLNGSASGPGAIAQSHREALANQSYRFRMLQVREVAGSERPVVSEERVTRVGERYLYRLRARTDAGGVPEEDVYDNGSAVFVAGYQNDSVARVERFRTPPPAPRQRAAARLRTYLDTPNVAMERIETSGETREWVVGTGAPPNADAETYRFELVRSESGLVTHLRIVYQRPDGLNGSVRWVYEPLANATLDAPAWYERRYGTNTTTGGENTTTESTETTTEESTASESENTTTASARAVAWSAGQATRNA